MYEYIIYQWIILQKKKLETSPVHDPTQKEAWNRKKLIVATKHQSEHFAWLWVWPQNELWTDYVQPFNTQLHLLHAVLNQKVTSERIRLKSKNQLLIMLSLLRRYSLDFSRLFLHFFEPFFKYHGLIEGYLETLVSFNKVY